VQSGISKAAIYLTVNGADRDVVELELGQPCSIEIQSTDNTQYGALAGFEWDPRGEFIHTETRPEAGTDAWVEPWGEPYVDPPLYCGYVVLTGLDPLPGVHFLFQYTAREPVDTQLELWLWDSIAGDFYQVDTVWIVARPPHGPEGACCDKCTGNCHISEIWDCLYDWLGPGTDCSLCKAPPEVKVEIHTVKGSGITEKQIREWIDKASQIDCPDLRFVVDSNHVYEPNTPYDPNKNEECKINIWGLRKCVVTADGTDLDYVSGTKGKVVELIPGKTDPCDPNGLNVYIKDSTLAHELNHIFGLTHKDSNGIEDLKDPDNKMYPDNDWNKNGKLRSCHRKGTKLEPWQRKILKEGVGKFLKAKDATIGGYGDETYDNIGDVGFEYIDLDWIQGWIEWIQNTYLLHLTTQVRIVSFETYSELGFYIESDNCQATGQPPEGFDYYLALQPANEQITFLMYDTDWVPLDPAGIVYEYTYIDKDANVPPIPAGVRFELPLPLLRGRVRDVISYRAAAQNNVETDMSPNTGLLSIKLHPEPTPGDLSLDGKFDNNDLQILTENWLKTGCSVADIYPAPDGDNIVNFKDLAILASRWLYEPGIVDVVSIPSGESES
jgi:hypothetical protein